MAVSLCRICTNAYSHALFDCISHPVCMLIMNCLRLLKLLEEISQEEESKTIIFVETKRKVDDITRSIARYG